MKHIAKLKPKVIYYDKVTITHLFYLTPPRKNFMKMEFK